MIRHTVLFRLRRPVQEPARARFVEALRAFAVAPPRAVGPASLRVDLGLRAEGPRIADALLEMEFRDAEAFAAYVVDDRHRALVADVLEPSCEGWSAVQTTI